MLMFADCYSILSHRPPLNIKSRWKVYIFLFLELFTFQKTKLIIFIGILVDKPHSIILPQPFAMMGAGRSTAPLSTFFYWNRIYLNNGGFLFCFSSIKVRFVKWIITSCVTIDAEIKFHTVVIHFLLRWHLGATGCTACYLDIFVYKICIIVCFVLFCLILIDVILQNIQNIWWTQFIGTFLSN